MFFDDEQKQRHIRKERAEAKKMKRSRWWQNLIRNRCRCYLCDKELSSEEVTMEHIVPLSEGGFSRKGNIAASCQPCNQKKYDRTAFEVIADDADFD